MRSLQSIFLCLIVFLIAGTGSASPSGMDNGGISGGGGGGTAPGRQITEAEVAGILKRARLEIYMTLALQEQTNTFPWPQLFQGDKNIYDIIFQYPIYGSKDDCHDSFGNSKDGSIHSPAVGTLCISLKNLSQKLTIDNARPQILALVAHEYSHLKGFDEDEAIALQKWFIKVFANSSSDQALNVLDYMTRQALDIADYVQFYNTKPKAEMTWDFLCFISDKIETSLIITEQQFTDKPFSISTRKIYTQQNSYLVKQRAIKTQACALSSFHPQKLYQQQEVQKWFAHGDVIFDKDLVDDFLRTAEYDVSRNILILGNLPVSKINTFEDFDREFKSMEVYLSDLRFHLNQLWRLDENIIE